MRISSLLSILLWALSLPLSSCTTIERAKITHLKNVAIIGYDLSIQESGSGLHRSLAFHNDREFGPKVISLTQNQLKGAFGWKFVPQATVEGNDQYATAVKNVITQVNKFFNSHNFVIEMPKMLSAQAAKTSFPAPATRRKLAKALKADGLLEVSVRCEPAGNMLPKVLASAASVSNYKATIDVRLFAVGDDDPIWNKPGFTGETSDNVVVTVFGINFSDEKERAIVSSIVNAWKSAITDVNES